MKKLLTYAATIAVLGFSNTTFAQDVTFDKAEIESHLTIELAKFYEELAHVDLTNTILENLASVVFNDLAPLSIATVKQADESQEASKIAE